MVKPQQERQGHSAAPVQHPRKVSSNNANMELESEQESERSSEGSQDEQPGIDEGDYDNIDLHESFERATWGQDDSPTNAKSQSDVSDSKNMEVDDKQDWRKTSTLSRSQKQCQAAEQPLWISHRHTTSTASNSTSKSALGAGVPSDCDTDDHSNKYSSDPHSIKVVIQQGARYPILTCQPPRIASVIRQAFLVSEHRIAFQNPYPPLANFDWFFRVILRDAAWGVGDDEIADQLKTNAPYGNLLAHLVKARFTHYQREIRDHTKSEARAVYQLKPGPGQEQRVKELLLDDTFVYGVDKHGNAINSEPYRHPAVVNMIQFFFADNRSIGQRQASSFKSTFTEEKHKARSKEKEVLIAMVAFSAAMLWAELLLWKSGSHSNAPFDADTYSTAYKHHAEALRKLQSNFPVWFHNLMHFLYVEGR
ncbi:hypothetical protein H1R20_g16617, partial [Candolleomyces eurysporus]